MTTDEFIEERLDAMLLHPEFWGSTAAFELQVLLLLELRSVTKVPAPSQVSLRWLVDTYHAFVRSVRPGAPPRPLSAQGDDLASIASMLTAFRNQLIAVESPGSSPTTADDEPSAPEELGEDVKVDVEHSRVPRASGRTARGHR